jgi:DNA-binding NarL/FixJ family response regulator
MLARRNEPGGLARARVLAAQAREAGEAIGMARVSEQAAALQAQIGLPRPRDAVEETPVPSAPPAVGAPDGLTEREVEVLQLLAEGQTNREIADTLVLSIRTVDHHIAKIYRKIDARRRADAAAYALRRGLVSVGARTG